MGAFHAYDIRGVYGRDFDRNTAYRIGYFIPGMLSTDRVLVGHDCRVSSDEISEYLCKGICDAGADVYDMGLSSTPLVYFGTAAFGFKASVQITASHNSAEYNGMKISRENALPVGLDSGLDKIRDLVESDAPTPSSARRGRVHEYDIRKDYVSFLKKFKGDYSNLNIAFDLSNGMANLFAPELFSGENASFIFDSFDGRFPNHDPNPLIAKNVQPLRDLVASTGADVGVIYDGDADRVMFVDDKARFVSPDLVIALMAIYFCDIRGAEKPRVLQEIRSSKAVGECLSDYGAELHTWKVGRAYAAPKLREIDGLWGGELAGHYYFKDFFYSDSGLISSMIVLNIVSFLKSRGLSLSDRIDSMTHYRNSGEVNFRVDDKIGAMDALKDFFQASQQPSAFMDFDGYRLEFADWWFNVRPSNTEPYLRLICEAVTDELLAEKLSEACSIIVNKFGGEKV